MKIIKHAEQEAGYPDLYRDHTPRARSGWKMEMNQVKEIE